MGRYNSFLRSPKKEERQVPNTAAAGSSESKAIHSSVTAKRGCNIMDKLEEIFGAEENDELALAGQNYSNFEWNFMEFGDGQLKEEYEDVDMEVDCKEKKVTDDVLEDQNRYSSFLRRETLGFGFGEDEENPITLNLSLNYQEVLEAWSDRGSL
ncbi:PREDICTED: uncharacterized protein LOC104597359 [Nelumbo nucifera]|uniref:Uncharacterized protein LOC104597359 n=1 Tax=Nelumbo nucifera TaxID=4432 RepID=A0A1U7ZS96_NELNU|nr:PREDICTED: uncharacterized protein LOC104597359 [Nelumbo nucifera]